MLKSIVCAVCVYLILQSSCSQEFNSTNVRPTPLILHLNQSAAQMLMQQANSMFVSNTSFYDVVNDNETQRLLHRYRERKRQVRIMTIQREILQKLGITRGPNVTARLSAEERETLVRSFDRTMMEHNHTLTSNETSCFEQDDESVC